MGRQLINYNSTLLTCQLLSGAALGQFLRCCLVVKPECKREHLGIFAASPMVPQAFGVSPHQEGNNIYGAYGRLDNFLVRHSNIEPFFLWRVQPAEVVEPAVAKTTGHENEKAVGLRFKAQSLKSLDYTGELIVETGKVGTQPIRAWALQGGAAYQFLDGPARPRVAHSSSGYASGNEQSAAGEICPRRSVLVELVIRPPWHHCSLFGWQNIESVRAGATVEPHQRLTFTVQGLNDWAAESLDSIYNTSGSAIVTNKTDHGRHVDDNT